MPALRWNHGREDEVSKAVLIALVLALGVCLQGSSPMDTASAASSAGRGSLGARARRLTRILRLTDPYFAKERPSSMRRSALEVCGMLQRGTTVEEIVSVEVGLDTPASSTGNLISAAVAVYCPEYGLQFQDFVRRHD